ncbi:MAG: recombinase family protein, partial [Clostridiales bacterium]
MLTHTRFLGYDRNDDGGLIINKEQAEIVTRIFNEYLNGKGCKRIASELAGDNIMGINGTSKWYPGTIKRMLSNEKYKGDALLQKSYTADFLTKKRVKNKRELTQYYIENSHPAIIDKT